VHDPDPHPAPVVARGGHGRGQLGQRRGTQPGHRLLPLLVEPVEQLAGRDLVVLHGTRDLTTSPDASARFVARAAPLTRRAVCLRVPWSGHGMLLRASTWQRLTAAFVAAIVDDASFDRPLELAREARAIDVTEAIDP
jgi:hypothetical protein